LEREREGGIVSSLASKQAVNKNKSVSNQTTKRDFYKFLSIDMSLIVSFNRNFGIPLN